MSIATSDDHARQLQSLAEEIAKMGGLVEEMVQGSVLALTRQNASRARRVIQEDNLVDDAQRRVEALAEQILCRYQLDPKPIREVVSALRIASDLERVGDHAKNNAKRVIEMEGVTVPGQLATGLEHISDMALEQLKTVLDAYTSQDRQAALIVRRRDDEVDAIYDSLFRELLSTMSQSPDSVTQGVHLLFIAKNIERIGDHATNIAEAIHYVVTGEQPSEARSRRRVATGAASPGALNAPTT